MSKTDPEGKARRRADEVKELVQRCRKMEQELADIKERLARVQRTVEEHLPKTGGSKSDRHIQSKSNRSTGRRLSAGERARVVARQTTAKRLRLPNRVAKQLAIPSPSLWLAWPRVRGSGPVTWPNSGPPLADITLAASSWRKEKKSKTTPECPARRQ
jgi:hypothetical protein